jgi:hypothetical protein
VSNIVSLNKAFMVAMVLRVAVDDFRLTFAYALRMGVMKRRMAWENEQSARYASTVAICAAIIAAVRLARDNIDTPSPRVVAAVGDSVTLARLILKRVVGR